PLARLVGPGLRLPGRLGLHLAGGDLDVRAAGEGVACAEVADLRRRQRQRRLVGGVEALLLERLDLAVVGDGDAELVALEGRVGEAERRRAVDVDRAAVVVGAGAREGREIDLRVGR